MLILLHTYRGEPAHEPCKHPLYAYTYHTSITGYLNYECNSICSINTYKITACVMYYTYTVTTFVMYIHL